MFLAEPLYILLAAEGRDDAHEAVKTATLRAQKEGRSIFEVIADDPSMGSVRNNATWKKLEKNPDGYTGKARERALELAGVWESYIDGLGKKCTDYRSVMDG